jgi:hypothetical protein
MYIHGRVRVRVPPERESKTVGNKYSSTLCYSQRHIQRQAAQNDWLPKLFKLMGDGNKLIEIVYGEEANILYSAD